MPNYQEGKIYKIYNTINDDIYVGSTSLKLCERMRDHRRTIKHHRKQHLPLYNAFREHGIDNFFIELIEKYPCNDVEELRQKEGEYIINMKPTLNTRVPGRSDKDCRKLYYENNKELLLQKQLDKLTCGCGCVMNRSSMLRHKRTTKHIELMKDKLN